MRSAGLAVRDIPEDSGVELGSGWGPALTSYRDLGRKGQSQDGLHLYLYSSLTLLQIDKYIIVHTLRERGYPLTNHAPEYVLKGGTFFQSFRFLALQV